MKRRLVVIAAVVLLALGIAVAVWAAGGTPDSSKADDCAKTVTVEDTMSPKMMEYHRADCDDDFAVTRSKGGSG